MGFKTKEIPYEMRVGRDINAVSNLSQTIADQDQEFDFILIDVCHAMNFRTAETIESRKIALTRSDTCVKSYHWQDFVLAKINSYLTDCDSKYEHIRLRSEAIMTQEINFAMHLSINAIVVDFPQTPRIENFARILNTYFQNVHNSSKFILRIQVPSEFKEAEETYQKYLQFKQLCGHFPGIQVILELQSDLASWEYFLHRWISDKIFAIQLDSSIFLQNSKNVPVLSKKHQEVVKNFMKYQVRFILKSRHPNDNLDDHYQYLCYLFKNHDKFDAEDRIEINYRNYLQSPLQPLADNLESTTYETFENDTIKYDLYEDSLYKAFLDKKKYGRFFQTKKPLEIQEDKVMIDVANQEIVVMYFGAGRGPLIRKALKAAERADVKIKVIALDKNPNAIVTLRNMIIDEKLEDRVELFAGDMRSIQISEMQGDILMSELLGSFGDNELSPECLNPTSKFLRPGGIFVPYSYTNYVVPLSSQIIWNEVNIYASQGLTARVPISQQIYPFELPYVVKIYSANHPCGQQTQEVFTFRHLPYPDQEELKKLPEGEEQSLKKYDRVKFVVEEEQSEIHGFGGYFTAELYQDIFYSTNPEQHTPGMHSWFPMYFPVKDPFIVFKGQEVNISIWRNNSHAKVWYEWSMSVFDPALNRQTHTTHIHNINGRGFKKPKNKKPHVEGEDDSEEEHPLKKDEEQIKYHESVINDVYNSMSDSEEEDEEESQKRLHEQIQEETKQKEEELKMQKIQSSLTSLISHQVLDKVNKAVESAKHYQQEIKVDKVKGMFNSAFTKFNEIVDKNKANLPELNIQELINEPKAQKTTLNDYLRKRSVTEEKMKTVKQQETPKTETHENFKIGEDGNSEHHSEQEAEDEEFSDSEDSQQQNLKEKSPSKELEEEIKNEETDMIKADESLDKWLEILEKGKQLDVTELKLYTGKKDTADKSVIYNIVRSYDTRQLALIKGHLVSFQLVQQTSTTQAIKEQLNSDQIKKFATSFFQKSKEKLMALKNPSQQAVFDHPKQEQDEQVQPPKDLRKLAMMKGLISLERLYMIDIVEKGKKEIEVIMHFVNKQYNPMMSPIIKKYRMSLDEQTQDFLVNLQREISTNNSFYTKVTNAFKSE